MAAIEFVVPGIPIGKGRPKVASRRGKFAHLYTPQKTVSYEKLVAQCGQVAMVGRPLMLGALYVRLTIALPIPASWSNKKRAAALAGAIYAMVKPDIDNVEKSIFDGLNGVVWRDDVQVVDVSKQKFYSDNPGVEIFIRPLEDANSA